MSTRDEVEQLLELLMQKVLSARLLRDEESETEWIELADAEVVDARARLLALLAPEPSEREVEAGAKALYDLGSNGLAPWEDRDPDSFWSKELTFRAKAVLTAARAARQTGGEA